VLSTPVPTVVWTDNRAADPTSQDIVLSTSVPTVLIAPAQPPVNITVPSADIIIFPVRPRVGIGGRIDDAIAVEALILPLTVTALLSESPVSLECPLDSASVPLEAEIDESAAFDANIIDNGFQKRCA
jgi:hypothetical protein